MTPAITTLSTVLSELYRIDPELKKHEAELIPLIKTLLEKRPDAVPDEQFVQELRSRLMSVAAELKEQRRPWFSFINPFPVMSMSKITMALTGAIAGIVIAVPATTLMLQNRPAATEKTESDSPLFSYSVTRQSATRAFGDLYNLNSGAAEGRGGGLETGASGGESDAAVMMAPDAKMMPPGEITQLEYFYPGSLPEIPAEVEVFRRDKALQAVAASRVIADFNLGMLDLASFENARVDSLIFSQDREFGYSVNMMLRDGQLGINQNWERWPHPENNCRDEACYRQYRIRPDEIPADEEIIRIAKEFVASHKIDVSRYGQPEVDNQWRTAYDRTENKNEAYVPEAQRVVYPLLIEDKPVYDQQGMKTGISVNVHVRHKRVSDVWGIQTLKFESSAYPAASADQVNSYLSQFGAYPVLYERENGIKVNRQRVELGEPTLGLAMYYMYKEGEASPAELTVPSLIFPVIAPQSTEIWAPQAVTVPLAREVMEKTGNPDGLMRIQ